LEALGRNRFRELKRASRGGFFMLFSFLNLYFGKPFRKYTVRLDYILLSYIICMRV